MNEEAIQIKRYPNRRFYSRSESKYVSLQDIEQLIRDGRQVEIRDSQTGEDLTRSVLAQIIMDRQPEKMSLFPVDMLHFIVRSNDMMSGFLRDYFRQSLVYLDYLQRHGSPAPAVTQPMHWMKAWLDNLSPKTEPAQREPPTSEQEAPAEPIAEAVREAADEPQPAREPGALEQRIKQLEQRLRQLESATDDTQQNGKQ